MPTAIPISPPAERDEDGLHEELAQNVAAPCADGPPQPDLPGALGDRDQHDVHDADAADDERDRGDGGQEQAEDVRGRLLAGQDFREVAEGEVVVLVGLEMVALAQQVTGLLLGFLDPGGVADLDEDPADRPRIRLLTPSTFFFAVDRGTMTVSSWSSPCVL